MSSTLRGTILALLTLALPSCMFTGDSGVRISSTPAGAYIFLDGEDTGKTTPAMLDLGSMTNLGGLTGGDRIVTVRKKGYEPEQRTIYHHSSVYSARWLDGATTLYFITAPLFWTMEDFFFPMVTEWDYIPHELHVTLYPEGEAPGK